MNRKLPMTDRTQVRRKPERSDYDLKKIYEVIDNSLTAVIAFTDGDSVHAIPTLIWREQDHLFIHGSNASRLLAVLKNGAEVCVSISQVDGLVLARSALNHSVNYQSVCIYGMFTPVPETEKFSRLQYFLEHWLPGRWAHVRQPSAKELAITTILQIPILEAVFKGKNEGPRIDPIDQEVRVWAGVIPLERQWSEPIPLPGEEFADLPGKQVRPIVVYKN